jgi:hypothetical protein
VWLCIAEGFPSTPFLVNEDLSRADGVIQCTHVTEAQAISFGWRVARAIRIVLAFLS